MSNLIFFEDERVGKLNPLVHLRPVWELRCGITSLQEKIQRNYPKASPHFVSRSYLMETIRERNHGAPVGTWKGLTKALFVNGRLLANGDLSKAIPLEGPDELFVSDGWVIAARLSGDRLRVTEERAGDALQSTVWDELRNRGVKTTNVSVRLIQYPWELVAENPEQIGADFKMLASGRKERGKVHESVVLYQPEQVFVGEGSEVMAQVVIDARGGPVYIGKNVTILPHTRIEGPAYVGDNTRILGGKIRTGSSIGAECRIGGEVEDSIIHAHNNKQHDGFLGHAYICEWVNLGAATNNSDLKNNYGHVKVWNDGEMRDTGERFVGCFIGDHTKVGIGSLINTGTVLGVAANFFGGGVTPKFIPSFAWGGVGGFQEHRVDEAVETARIVMQRRKVEMSAGTEKLLRDVFHRTASERSPQTMPALTR